MLLSINESIDQPFHSINHSIQSTIPFNQPFNSINISINQYINQSFNSINVSINQPFLSINVSMNQPPAPSIIARVYPEGGGGGEGGRSHWRLACLMMAHFTTTLSTRFVSGGNGGLFPLLTEDFCPMVDRWLRSLDHLLPRKVDLTIILINIFSCSSRSARPRYDDDSTETQKDHRARTGGTRKRELSKPPSLLFFLFPFVAASATQLQVQVQVRVPHSTDNALLLLVYMLSSVQY